LTHERRTRDGQLNSARLLLLLLDIWRKKDDVTKLIQQQ
jgi:hypothetical protein